MWASNTHPLGGPNWAPTFAASSLPNPLRPSWPNGNFFKFFSSHMHFFTNESGATVGVVFHPEAIARHANVEPMVEPARSHADDEPAAEIMAEIAKEPRQKRRKVNPDSNKHGDINEWKMAVQDSLSPVFLVYHEWCASTLTGNLPCSVPLSSSLAPPPINHMVTDRVPTDWLGLFARRFEVWPKLMIPDSSLAPLFGQLHLNSTSTSIVATISSDASPLDLKVSLLPRSRFLMTHGVQTLGPLLHEIQAKRDLGEIQAKTHGFSILVVDPPWENASVRRGGGGYESLPAGELTKLPIRELLNENGLMFMWVTNRPRILKFINEVLLARWGLKLLRTWYWVKTDGSGKPVIPLDCLHRHCYEPLLILAPESQDHSLHLSMLPADNFVMFSEQRQHSRKPYLGPLITELTQRGLCPQLRRDFDHQLELFGREMHEGWTTWGNEVLKFQEC